MSAKLNTLKPSKTHNSSSDESSGDESKGDEYGTLIADVSTCLKTHLSTLMSQMFDAADEYLSELSEKSESKESKTRYQGVKRLVQIKRNPIDAGFFATIDRIFETKSSDSADAVSDLALVDQDEMEEMVAITTIHANAMNQFGEEINNLEARLEYLEIKGSQVLDKQALDTRHICEAYQASLKSLDITIEQKLVLYKMFDQKVCSQSAEMYQAINQIFIDAGILPEIILKTSEPEEIEEDTTESPGDTSEEDNSHRINTTPSNKNQSATVQDDIQQVVNHFLNESVSRASPDIPASFSKVPCETDDNGKNFYPRKDVMGALSKLQNRMTQLEKEAQLNVEQIKQALMADIGSANGGAVTKQVHLLDERSIDFVGMMFDVITNDVSISRVITNLLLRLQIPVIKVAMLDQELFSDEEHPARNVLNLIPEAGKGVTEEKDEVYTKIENIVDDILRDFDVDIESFTRAVDALEDLIKYEEALSKETENKEQLELLRGRAREVVINELKHISENKKLPEAVHPLVLKSWSTLMFNSYMKHGKQSEGWIQSIILLKIVLNYLQPIKGREQWEEIKDNHLAIIKAVNDELYSTNQNRAEIDSNITALKDTIRDSLDKYGAVLEKRELEKSEKLDGIDTELTDIDIEKGEIPEVSTADELARINEDVEMAKTKVKQLPANVRPGTWFEVYTGEDTRIRRVKLSVILMEMALLVFVDRRGNKVIEKDIEAFVKELNDSKSAFIADHSTFDHALGKVINTLAA